MTKTEFLIICAALFFLFVLVLTAPNDSECTKVRIQQAGKAIVPVCEERR